MYNLQEKAIRLLHHCSLPQNARKRSYETLMREYPRKVIEKKFKELAKRGYIHVRPGDSFVYAELSDKGRSALRFAGIEQAS